jgi:hypothetical protein
MVMALLLTIFESGLKVGVALPGGGKLGNIPPALPVSTSKIGNGRQNMTSRVSFFAGSSLWAGDP